MSTFAFAVTHIETALELANIIRPSMIPLPFIIRNADNIVDIILNKNTDCTNIKFMTLILMQAYILLDVAMIRNSFKGKIRIFVKINNYLDKIIYVHTFLSKYILNIECFNYST